MRTDRYATHKYRLFRVLPRTDGKYVAIDGFVDQSLGRNIFDEDELDFNDVYKAEIVSVDDGNMTGMYHDAQKDKDKYVGCIVTVREAHYAGDLTVYYSPELQEYFTENELTILEKE